MDLSGQMQSPLAMQLQPKNMPECGFYATRFKWLATNNRSKRV
jgi:hypothetical protein